MLVAGAPLAGAAVFRALATQVGEISRPGFSVRELRVRLDAHAQAGSVEIGRLRIGAREWRALALRCGSLRIDAGVLACSTARVERGGRRLPFEADVEVALGAGPARIALRLADGGRIEAGMEADGRVRARLHRITPDAALLEPWLGELAAGLRRFKATGLLEAEFDYRPADADAGVATASLRGRVAGGGFGGADGLLAAEGVDAGFILEARSAGAAWSWSAQLDWDAGAAYVHPLLVEAGPRLRARGSFDGRRVALERAELELDGFAATSARGVLDTAAGTLDALAIELVGADLARIGPRWLAPLLVPASARRLRFEGRADVRAELRAGRLETLGVELHTASFGLAPPQGAIVAEGGGGEAASPEVLAFGPVDGRVRWSARGPGTAALQVGGGRWEKLALGAVALDAALEPAGLRIAGARIPLLDGALAIEDLALGWSAAGWEGRGGVVLEPVSMPLLTAALGLPTMAGVMSAALPGLKVGSGELVLDGTLAVSVFDGWLQASGLRVREPFGIASHLTADIEARHIDLAQLTETFSFGSISGHIDAEVRGLELSSWRPTAFDARIASIEGDERRRISQRAVENLSALGGGGALAAVQRSVLRLFETFGYRELGLRCRLAHGVCEMGGLRAEADGGARVDGGFTIVRGGGIPALDVIGYNRRVDWNELVARLQRVVADDVSPTID
ncbi:MAG: hypothetical protein KUL79_08470 [Thauera sp.]|nr:hypothetical protein [Thauera sp.]